MYDHHESSLWHTWAHPPSHEHFLAPIDTLFVVASVFVSFLAKSHSGLNRVAVRPKWPITQYNTPQNLNARSMLGPAVAQLFRLVLRGGKMYISRGGGVQFELFRFPCFLIKQTQKHRHTGTLTHRHTEQRDRHTNPHRHRRRSGAKWNGHE